MGAGAGAAANQSLNMRMPSILKRCCSWRVLRWCIGGVAVLVTLLFLVFALENWRGRRAWERYRAEVEAKGEKLSHVDFAPPPVPDDQNFTRTPFLAPLFDFKPGTQEWRDTNALRVVQTFAADVTRSAPGKVPEALRGILEESRTRAVFGNHRLQKPLDLQAWYLLYEARQGRVPTHAATLTRAAAGEGVLQALQPYEPVLAEIRTALGRPHARFGVVYDVPDPSAILLPHLAVLRTLTQLGSLRATAALATGRAGAAVGDIEMMLDLADTLRSEPILISYLVRLAMVQMACQALWEGLGSRAWTEAELARLQARMERFDLLADLRRAMRGERAFGNAMIAAYQRGVAHPAEAMGSVEPGRPVVPLMPSGWWYLERVNYNRLFEDYLLAGLDQPHCDPAALARLEQGLTHDMAMGWKLLLRHQVMANLLLPALSRAVEKGAHMQAVVSLGVVACALERHRLATGALPAELAALVPGRFARLPVDPIRGGALQYRREPGDHYTIYSIGWDLKDGGGEVGYAPKSSAANPVVDVTRGDWVWKSKVLTAP